MKRKKYDKSTRIIAIIMVVLFVGTIAGTAAVTLFDLLTIEDKSTYEKESEDLRKQYDELLKGQESDAAPSEDTTDPAPSEDAK